MTPPPDRASLEPCPFCGAAASSKTSKDGYTAVWCDNPECGLPETNAYVGDGAAKRWNRRAPSAEGRLRKALQWEAENSLDEATQANCLAALKENAATHSIEDISRKAFPEAWAKVDANISDDDWMGGTALNLRHQLLSETRAVIAALRGEP